MSREKVHGGDQGKHNLSFIRVEQVMSTSVNTWMIQEVLTEVDIRWVNFHGRLGTVNLSPLVCTEYRTQPFVVLIVLTSGGRNVKPI